MSKPEALSSGALPPPEHHRCRIQAELVESTRLAAGHHRLVLLAPAIAAVAQPGQFLHIWCHPPNEIDRHPCAAMLRRPYSISRLHPPDAVEILLRVRGTGGRMLAGKTRGDVIDVIGPLGNGFSLAEDLGTGVIVAGGVGLAPAPFLVERLLARGARAVLLAGAIDDERVPFAVERSPGGGATLPELAALGAEVSFVTEAVEGLLVSELLESRLPKFGDDATIFAIGPRAMLKRLAEITEGRRPLQVSLEERMACGLGVCRSCVVPVRGADGDAYQTVCRDGPVFSADQIDWEKLTT